MPAFWRRGREVCPPQPQRQGQRQQLWRRWWQGLFGKSDPVPGLPPYAHSACERECGWERGGADGDAQQAVLQK